MANLVSFLESSNGRGWCIEFPNRWPSWYLNNWWLRLNQACFRNRFFMGCSTTSYGRHAYPILNRTHIKLRWTKTNKDRRVTSIVQVQKNERLMVVFCLFFLAIRRLYNHTHHVKTWRVHHFRDWGARARDTCAAILIQSKKVPNCKNQIQTNVVFLPAAAVEWVQCMAKSRRTVGMK